MPEPAPPHDHLADLLGQIEPAAQRVADLVANPRIHSVRVWLGHQTDNENPGISLADSILKKLAEPGTGVELDIYALASDADSGDD